MTHAAFLQADINRDNALDLNEFRNFVQQNNYNGGNGYSSHASSHELSSTAGALGGANYEASYRSDVDSGLAGGVSSSYNSASSYSADNTGYGVNGLAGGIGYGAAGLAGGVGYEAAGLVGGAGYGASSTESVSSTAVQRYATDSRGLFQDSNPQIIRRPAPGGPLTYTQNIRVRFLQPPAIPPPGPLIIKEVRPAQPPPPPPLRIRQQAPALPQPPPLVLRERPPVPPQTVASQTVIRRLAALPVPPRSTIIERIPAAPARPRDIIIERWVPYGAAAKRRTIVQRAAAAQQYAQPRNVIVQYDNAQARIVRQFQKLGVQAENPAAYVQRYGAQLLDAATLVQQARAAGVVEDISPPAAARSFTATESHFSTTGDAFGAGGIVGGLGLGTNIAHSEYESHSSSGVVGIDSPAVANSHVVDISERSSVFGAPPVLSAGFGDFQQSVSTFDASSSVGSGLGFATAPLLNAGDVNQESVVSHTETTTVNY